MISYFLFSNFLFLIFMVDIFLKVWDTFFVMREEFKPKKEELLRKAWKAEWDSMEEPKITWEEFKHRKQRKSFIPKKRGWLFR